MKGAFVILALLLGISFGNAVPITKCPPQHETAGTKYSADSEDPTIYYVCNWGKPILKNCPAGARWDQSIPNCVGISSYQSLIPTRTGRTTPVPDSRTTIISTNNRPTISKSVYSTSTPETRITPSVSTPNLIQVYTNNHPTTPAPISSALEENIISKNSHPTNSSTSEPVYLTTTSEMRIASSVSTPNPTKEYTNYHPTTLASISSTSEEPADLFYDYTTENTLND